MNSDIFCPQKRYPRDPPAVMTLLEKGVFADVFMHVHLKSHKARGVRGFVETSQEKRDKIQPFGE